MTVENIPLCIPGEHRGRAQLLGARWNRDTRTWNVASNNKSLDLFAPWLPSVYLKKYFPALIKGLALEAEVVPETCMFSNLRSVLTPEEWRKVADKTYIESAHRCRVCGGKGDKHPVEAHEIWDYNMGTLTQTLVGVTSLCPPCHEVKHIGLAGIRGRAEIALARLKWLNNFSDAALSAYIEQTYSIYEERSIFEWDLNISYIERYGISKNITDRWTPEALKLREDAFG